MVHHQSIESLAEVLGVQVDATQEELKRAYRKKAAQLHPDKAIHKSRGRATQEFQQLSHAFEVLSNTEKRKSYDNTHTFDDDFARKKGAHGHQSPEGSLQQLFKDFFGDRSLPSGLSSFNNSATFSFQSCWNHQQSSIISPGAEGLFSSGFSTTSTFSTAAATKDRELPLTLTLEEVLRGGEKDLTVNRRLADGVSGRLIPVDEAVIVHLTPGIREGTRIVLRGRGDECPGRGCSDLVLVVREELHAQFERSGNDILTCVSIPLLQALTADSVLVPTLDGGQLPVALSGPITPETVLRVPGKGMPVPEEPGRAGDLCVRFRIAFPRSVTPSQKHQLRAALQ